MRLKIKTSMITRNFLAARVEMLNREKINNEKMKDYFNDGFVTFHKAIANILDGEYDSAIKCLQIFRDDLNVIANLYNKSIPIPKEFNYVRDDVLRLKGEILNVASKGS